MRIRKNGKVINLTELDLRRIVKRVINEQDDDTGKGIEANISDKNCVGSGTPTIALKIFETLTEMMGYSCVGRINKINSKKIVLKKYIDCGLVTRTLYIIISTEDFGNLVKVGDISYYCKGIGEGKTTLREISGLERRITESCEEKDKCITYEEFKTWFDSRGYEFKQTSTGVSFKKYCGNVKSVINLTTSNGGCVEKIDERQYVYPDDGDSMESGQLVWDRKTGSDMSLDKILYEIIDAVNYGYKKYEQWIEGCSGLLK